MARTAWTWTSDRITLGNDETRTAIVNDERFPSWDWAEIPQQQ